MPANDHPARRRRWAVALVATALVLAANIALLELAFGIYHYLKHGEFIWARTVSNNRDTKPSPTGFAPSGVRLSPYFGYVNDFGKALAARDQEAVAGRGVPKPRRACSETPQLCGADQKYFETDWVIDLYPTWQVNECGFASGYPCPYRPADKAVVIGIFGGSVAQNYAFWGSDTTSTVLKDVARRTGRRVVLLPFTMGGGKQPLQTQTLSYVLALGQRFDVVLNIDGFNEIYVGWLNANKYGVTPSMPFTQLVVAQENLFAQQVSGPSEATRVKEWRDYFVACSQETRFAIIRYFSVAASEYYAHALVRAEQELAKQKDSVRYPVQLTPATKGFSLQDVVDLWVNGSISMAAMAKAHGAAYIHVLQPSQYYSNRKFSDQETNEFNVLGEGDAPLRTIVPQAYDAYRANAAKLRAAGVRFVDATGIFEDTKRTIYYDWCCHFNYPGNVILDRLLTEHIVAAIEGRPPPPDAGIGRFDASSSASAKFDDERLSIIGSLINRARQEESPDAALALFKDAAGKANTEYLRGRLGAKNLLLDAYLGVAAMSVAQGDLPAAVSAYRSAYAATGTFLQKEPSDRVMRKRQLDVVLEAAPVFARAGDKDAASLSVTAAALCTQVFAGESEKKALHECQQAAAGNTHQTQ